MRLPLIPRRPGRPSGPRCIVCHGQINGDPEVRIRGMYFHRHCASYKTRVGASRR